MSKRNFNITQFKALLKKDLSLLFRKKIALFIFGGPFILMFVMFVIPSLFSSTESLQLLIYNEDSGYLSTDIGDSIVGNLTIYYTSTNDTDIELELADDLDSVLTTTALGLYIPQNFTELAFFGAPQLFTVDIKNNFLSEFHIENIYSIAENVMISMIANRSIPEIIREPMKPSTDIGELVLSPKAALIAYPLGYMIFLLIALNSSSNSLIGFAREKRMRTMETILAYTHNHSLLVISKAITGVVASLGSTLSYILGIVVATTVFNSNQDNLFDIFAPNLQYLSAFDIFIACIAVVTALILSTLMTMAVDCNLTREASERLSPLVSIGFAFFFYFVVIVNPYAFSSSLLINPFYWSYRLTLLIISKKFNYEVILYLLLIISVASILIYFATRGIQKEKSLYLE